MHFLKRYWVELSLVLLAFALVGLLVAVSYLLRSSLSLTPPADWSLFLEFDAKAFNPSINHHLSINSSASRNMASQFLYPKPAPGYGYVEGARSLYATLHYEPIRYVPAALYPIFHTPITWDLLISLLALSPLFYAAYLWKKVDVSTRSIMLCVALLAALYEPALYLWGPIQVDLALVPLFLVFGFSVVYERPRLEQLILLGVFVLTREEALCLAFPLILFGFWHNWRAGTRARVTDSLLLGVWSVGVVFYIFYLWWLGMPLIDAQSPSAPPSTPSINSVVMSHRVIVLIVAAIGTALVAWYMRHRGLLWRFASPLGAAFLLFWASIAIWLAYTAPLVPPPIFSLFGFLVLGCVSLSMIALQQAGFFTALMGGQYRRALYSALFVSGLYAGLLCAHAYNGSEYSFVAFVQAYGRDAQSARLVRQAHAELPQKQPIIVDDTTVIAFYDFDSVYSYQELPVYIATGTVRYYPKNTALIANLVINKNIRSAVLTRAGAHDVASILATAGKSMVPLAQNERYGYYAIR